MSQSTHLRDESPTARKDHRCYLCGETIPVGEKHVKRAGISDGNFYSDRMHNECENESRAWDEDDWEYFREGDMPRPAREARS